jgi:ribosomal-protein-serine acetyltransferase
MNPMLLDLPESVETERLLLRSGQSGDGPAMAAAIAESITELRQWLPWAREIPTCEEAEARSRQAQANFLARSDLSMRMIRTSDGLLVGSTGLHPLDWAVPSFEIGY